MQLWSGSFSKQKRAIMSHDIFRLKSDTDKVVLTLTLMRQLRCVIVVG